MLSAKELKILSSLKQKKFREQEGKFLIEGFHLIEECLGSSFYLEKIVIRKDVHNNKLDELRLKYKNKINKIVEISPLQFKKISETENSQGIIGEVKIPPKQHGNNNPEGNLIIALDRINDPGNLGTIIRTAYWFGTDRILIGENSADIYNSKVIRSSQGGIFHVNMDTNMLLTKELTRYKSLGYGIFLFTADGNKYLDEIKSPGKSVIVIGNEAEGISTEILALNFPSIKIRGFSNCESLNAAVSSAVGLYHFKIHMKV